MDETESVCVVVVLASASAQRKRNNNTADTKSCVANFGLFAREHAHTDETPSLLQLLLPASSLSSREHTTVEDRAWDEGIL